MYELTKTIYVANDETQFETEEECLNYELGSFKDKIHLYNETGKPVDLLECISHRYFEDVYGFKADDEEAFDFFRKILVNDVGYEIDMSNEDGRYEYYYCDEAGDMFMHVSWIEEQITHYTKIKNIIEGKEVKNDHN